MSKAKVDAKLVGNMGGFEMNLNGHKLITDGAEEIGGNNLGPRPKQLLLSGLIGCTGIDVMLILDKMKVEVEDVKLQQKQILQKGHLVFMKIFI